MAYPELALLVDGQRITTGLPTRPVIDPATEALLGHLPHADPVLLERAARTAAAGFAQWRAVPAHERAALLHEAAALLRRRAETVAADLTAEQGKPLAEAQPPVARGGAAPDRDHQRPARRRRCRRAQRVHPRRRLGPCVGDRQRPRERRRPDSDRTETPR
ncbi:aldehyde dehydrogenase family protein [Nonomuraea deserti]|uniref:Aldehyde dehydrogenase family protein n=1 Tax=Nonomuraea deserti TaxID=1848322 RepID=A0A4R4VEF5_9ACTN|nr:aldehyde dehydrogenase family protein [Nonomuraea deserti]TDC98009.1 aldehyde dehydrogenase family protein [Nonomuraea deserti]